MQNYQIKANYKGSESRNKVIYSAASEIDAKNVLFLELKKLEYFGAEILEQDKDAFTFQNNDHSNTVVTYYIEESK
jgi:hypothetical protein